MSSKRSKRFSYCLLSSLVLVHCVASYAATSDATQPATSQQIEIDRLIATASAWEIRSQPDRAREAIRKIFKQEKLSGIPSWVDDLLLRAQDDASFYHLVYNLFRVFFKYNIYGFQEFDEKYLD